MAVERAPGGTSLIDVLDRVLDKGIVIDAWVRISLVGIDLITIEARVVVASIDTYLKYAEAVGLTPAVSRPALTPGNEPVETETRRRVTLDVHRKCTQAKKTQICSTSAMEERPSEIAFRPNRSMPDTEGFNAYLRQYDVFIETTTQML